MQTQNTKRIQHIVMTHTLTSNIIMLLLRGSNFDKVMEVLSLLINSPHLVSGTITADCINEIFEICLAQAHVPIIFVSIIYIIYILILIQSVFFLISMSLYLLSDSSGIRHFLQYERSWRNG